MIQSETAAPTAPTRDAASGTIDASFSPRRIRRLAVRALLAELATFPKPGLVSLVDAGSHDDMDAATFVRSARALRGYFRDVAAAGRDGKWPSVLWPGWRKRKAKRFVAISSVMASLRSNRASTIPARHLHHNVLMRLLRRLAMTITFS